MVGDSCVNVKWLVHTSQGYLLGNLLRMENSWVTLPSETTSLLTGSIYIDIDELKNDIDFIATNSILFCISGYFNDIFWNCDAFSFVIFEPILIWWIWRSSIFYYWKKKLVRVSRLLRVANTSISFGRLYCYQSARNRRNLPELKLRTLRLFEAPDFT